MHLLCFLTFIRKDESAGRRPSLTRASSSTTIVPSVLDVSTTEHNTPFASFDALVDEKNSGLLGSLSEKKKTVTRFAGPDLGWNRTASSDRYLSISTLGSGSGHVEESPLRHTNTSNSSQRLAQLRTLMIAEPTGKIDYYIIPTEDALQFGDTAPGSDRRRAFITEYAITLQWCPIAPSLSDFYEIPTSIAGVSLISRSKAHLFVDSRYDVQTAEEIDNKWKIHRYGLPGAYSWIEWLECHPRGFRVGIDSRSISYEAAITLSSTLKERSMELVFSCMNLVDKVRKTEPSKRQGDVFVVDPKPTGRSATEKLNALRAWIRSTRPKPPSSKSSSGVSSKPVANFISSPSSIAWLLNIRYTDVSFNPVTFAYLFVSTHQAVLFINKAQLNNETRAYLKNINVRVKDYDDAWSFLQQAEWGDEKVLIDSKTPYAAVLILTPSRYILAPSWVDEQRGVGASTEAQRSPNLHARDGGAMVWD